MSAMATVPDWVVILIKSAILLLVVVTTFAYSMLAERKVLGWMQLRPGPNRVGPWGLMQPAADAAKLILKEDLTPKTADPPLGAVHLAVDRVFGVRDHSIRRRSLGFAVGDR